jgi:hypothetical protein
MEMSAFSFNSHPSEAGWHECPDIAREFFEEKNDVMLFCASEEV